MSNFYYFRDPKLYQSYLFHFNGVLNHIQYDIPHRKIILQNSSYRANLPDKPKHKCSECDLAQDLIMCQQCKSPYCMQCFNNVHRQAKVLRAHNYEPINDGQTKELNFQVKELKRKNICTKHDTSMKFYCTDCDILSCSLCNKDFHNNHQLITLKQQVSRFEDLN